MSTGKYLKIFAQEAGEHLESMRKGILDLEHILSRPEFVVDQKGESGKEV